jgi:PhnB protein
MVKAIPDGYSSVTPMLVVDGAAKLIDFIKETFGAQERMRMPAPDNKVGHAELTLGDSVIMVADATPQFSSSGVGGLHVYVEDVDAVYKKALSAGATSEMEPENQFYGDRSATVVDAFGSRWSIATHVEDVSEEEVMRRMQSMGGG